MRKLLLVLLVAAAPGLGQSPSCTTVASTGFNPILSASAFGSIQLSLSYSIYPSAGPVFQNTQQLSITAGVVTDPTTGISPCIVPGNYTVVYQINRPAPLSGLMPPYTRYWAVPSSGPTTIAAIETGSPAAPALNFAPSLINPGANGNCLLTTAGISGWGSCPGGTSIFTSYQFGTQSALTSTGLYLRTTYPSIFSLSQTGSGTSVSPYVDAISLAPQSANTFLRGPASGSATPSFGPLVSADIPALNYVSSVGVSSTPSWLIGSFANPTTTPGLALSAATGQTSHEVIGTCGSATSFAPCALQSGDIPSLPYVPTQYFYISAAFNDVNGSISGQTQPGGLQLSISLDGINLVSVNRPNNWNAYQDTGGSGSLRDPSITQMDVNGTTEWLIAYTTGPFTGNYSGPDYFTVMASTDLMNWTTIATPAGIASATQTWAPEWFIAPDSSVHILFAGSANNLSTSAVYETHPTNAPMTTWSTPVALTITGAPSSMYDPAEYCLSASSCFLFYTDGSHVRYATAASYAGTFTDQGDLLINGSPYDAEGPMVFPLWNTSPQKYELLMAGLCSDECPVYATSTDLVHWSTANYMTWTGQNNTDRAQPYLGHGTIFPFQVNQTTLGSLLAGIRNAGVGAIAAGTAQSTVSTLNVAGWNNCTVNALCQPAHFLLQHAASQMDLQTDSTAIFTTGSPYPPLMIGTYPPTTVGRFGSVNIGPPIGDVTVGNPISSGLNYGISLWGNISSTGYGHLTTEQDLGGGGVNQVVQRIFGTYTSSAWVTAGTWWNFGSPSCGGLSVGNTTTVSPCDGIYSLGNFISGGTLQGTGATLTGFSSILAIGANSGGQLIATGTTGTGASLVTSVSPIITSPQIATGSCQLQLYTASGSIAQYTAVGVSGTSISEYGTGGGAALGIAQSTVTNGQTVGVCFDGPSSLVMDGTSTSGDLAITSTSTGGYGHDSGQTSKNSVGEQVGLIGVLTDSCSGTPCTATVNLEGSNRTGRQILSSYLPGTIGSNTTGNAGTATALAATPTDCNAGSAPIGITASGNATGCAAHTPDPGAAGIVVEIANGTPSTTAARTLAAGSSKISVTNGNGVAGNPTVDLGTVPCAALSNAGSGCSTNTPFPNANLGGSIVALGDNGGGNLDGYPGGPAGGASTSCAAASPWVGSAAGWFRNIYTSFGAISSAGSTQRQGVSVDCFDNLAVPTAGSGPTVAGGSTAGSFGDTSGFVWHENSGSAWAFEGTLLGGAGFGTPAGTSAEFVADSGVMTTMLSNAYSFPLAASTTSYCSFYGLCGATELEYATPIPFAGTLQSFFGTMITVPTNTATYTINDNGSNTAITFTQPASGTSPFIYSDQSHSKIVAQGDYVDIVIVPGASTVSTTKGFSLSYTPTSGTPFLVAGAIEGTSGGTAFYYEPFSNANSSAVEASVAMPFPRGCSASYLQITLASTQTTGVTTTITVQDGGSSGSTWTTLLTGTIAAGTAPGVIVLDSTDTGTINKGDRISVKISSSGGTSGTLGHWSFQCI